MWNANNTVFGLKRSAICAQAVYFLHSTRPSVTSLNSRWSLAACDWVMSALSAVLWTHVKRRRKFGEISCTECTFQGNDFELILMVEIETRNQVDGYFGSKFPAICKHCGIMAAWSRKTLKIFEKFLRFLEKRPLTVKLSKLCSVTTQLCLFLCVCIHALSDPDATQHLWFTAPKFTKCLKDIESTSWVSVWYMFCDLTNRCKMPAQTIKAGYAKLSPFCATKLVAVATSLDRSSPNF